MDEYQTIINWGAGVCLSVLGWFARQLWDCVQSLKTDLSSLREDIAKNYVPKDDFKDFASELREMFRTISSKLDTKVDK